MEDAEDKGETIERLTTQLELNIAMFDRCETRLKELMAEIQQLKSRNPVVVARALQLYAYNVFTYKRVEHFLERRFPSEPYVDLDKWIQRFGNLEVPEELDVPSLACYVANAMDRYGEEAERVYAACGFLSPEVIRDLPSADLMLYFGGAWNPASMDMNGVAEAFVARENRQKEATNAPS